MKPMNRKAISLVFFISFICGCNFHPSGQVVWKFRTGFPGRARPVVSGKHLYIGSDKFYCLDAETGSVVWSFDPFAMVQARAVICNGMVYLQCGGLYCLDAETGKKIWEFWAGKWSDEEPSVADGRVYSLVKNRLYCLDAKTGRKLWHMKAGPSPVPPIVVGDMIYIGSNGRIQCIDVKDGRKARWLNIGRGWLRPVASSNRLYVVPWDNILYCINVPTGKVLWRHDFKTRLVSGLTLSDQYLYAGDGTGKVICFNAESGSTVWETDMGKPVIFDAPVLCGSSLYIRTLEKAFKNPAFQINRAESFILWGLDAATGKKLSRMKVPVAAFTVSGSFIYSGPGDYNVYCMKMNGDNR